MFRVLLVLVLLLTGGGLSEPLTLSVFEANGPASKILDNLGEAVTPLGPVQSPDGLWVCDWSYPDQGASFYVESPVEDGPLSIRSISIQHPCSWVLSNGVKIGTSLKQAQLLTPGLQMLRGDLWVWSDEQDDQVVGYQVEDGLIRSIYLGRRLDKDTE